MKRAGKPCGPGSSTASGGGFWFFAYLKLVIKCLACSKFGLCWVVRGLRSGDLRAVRFVKNCKDRE